MSFTRRKTPARVLLAAVATLGITALVGCSTPTADTGSEEKLTLRFTSFEPEGIVGHQARLFGDQIEKESNGNITVEYFWSGSLLPANEMATGISSGVADIGMILPPYNPSEFPVANWATVLGSMGDSAYPLNMLQGSAANAEAALASKELGAEFDKQGLKLLAPLSAYPSFSLLCNDPVTTLADAKGKRVRVGGQLWADEAQAVGMVPVALSGAEVYEAQQRGIVDCVMQHPPGFVGNGLWEIASEYTDAGFTGWNAMYLVMGDNKWESLSVEHQRVIWDASVTYFTATHEKSMLDYEKFATEGVDKHGVKFNAPASDLSEAIAKAQNDGLAKAEKTAPTQVADPKAFIESYRTAVNKWYDLSTSKLDVTSAKDGPVDSLKAFGAGIDFDFDAWSDLVKSEIFVKYRP